jgi:hypothetical protein
MNNENQIPTQITYDKSPKGKARKLRYKKTMPDSVKQNQKKLNQIKSKARWALTKIEGMPKPITISNAIPVLENQGFKTNDTGSKWVQIYDFLIEQGLIQETNP